MIVDSHCHINRLKGYDESDGLQNYLNSAYEQDVKRFLCVCIDLETLDEVMDVANTSEHIYASVGVHPNHTDCEEPDVARLVSLADNPKVVAIGETGLDYFRVGGDQQWQRDRFAVHIEAAKQTGKPLIIHTREAREDTIKVMQENKADEIGGVMHCFTENWEMAKAALDLNFYISFSGIVTFSSAKELQEVAKRVPLDRILVETDCPYLAPVPHRGQQNEPAHTRLVAEFVASLRGISVEEVAEATTENFYRLFSSAKQ
ncbi:MAG: TatD family hydrolase [Gammaproteobacteria bacterium]|nr:TatD family hydrolase [Gammaproteobacteria bacterium]MDH5693150.1 TatD family hydrolase [Gammaproteobacteria bacterium]